MSRQEEEEDDEGMWWGKFPHVQARIDDDRFQCAVPSWEPESKPSQNEPDQSLLVWDPTLGQPKRQAGNAGQISANQHLIFARTLTEQHPYEWGSTEDGSTTTSFVAPLESDEQALHFLVAHGGSRERAELNALALAGCGRGGLLFFVRHSL